MSKTLEHIRKLSAKTRLTTPEGPATLEVEDLVRALQKESADAGVQAYRARQEELAGLRGQAAAHAMMHEFLKISLAIQAGTCWRCKTSSVDPDSPYSRCASCDAEEA